MLVLSCLVVVLFVVTLPLRAASSPGLMPALFLLWLVVMGFTMVLQTELPVPELPPAMRRLFPDSKTEVSTRVSFIWLRRRVCPSGIPIAALVII